MISPWVDLTNSFPSFTKNKLTDILPSKSRITFGDRKHAYCPNEVLLSQYVSPVFAQSLADLQIPVLIQLGGCERLLDEGIYLYERLVSENPNIGSRLEIYQVELINIGSCPYISNI